VRIALLIIVAGIFYALGLWAHMRAARHLAPGVTLKDLAGSGADEEADRVASLYTPRGFQLQRLGKVFLLVGVLATIFLVIELVSLMPSIWRANVRNDPNQVLLDVAQNKPSILLIWLAALVFAGVGFMGARTRPWVAVPIAALVIFWSYKLAGGFPGRHQEIIGTATEPAYALQVWLAFAIVLFATGQGVRSWAVRYKKRSQEPVAGV